MGLTLYLIIGNFNYRINSKSMWTTFLPPKLKWLMSLAVWVEIPKCIYVYNIPKT